MTGQCTRSTTLITVNRRLPYQTKCIQMICHGNSRWIRNVNQMRKMCKRIASWKCLRWISRRYRCWSSGLLTWKSRMMRRSRPLKKRSDIYWTLNWRWKNVNDTMLAVRVRRAVLRVQTRDTNKKWRHFRVKVVCWIFHRGGSKFKRNLKPLRRIRIWWGIKSRNRWSHYRCSTKNRQIARITYHVSWSKHLM